jgi:hypothetical protein
VQDANFGARAVSRYKFLTEPGICHGAELLLRADAGVQVYLHYKVVMGAGVKAKTVTTCPAKAGNKLPILTVLALAGY